MNCPLCLDTVLDVTFHGGIELDICPRCRGVWLDRGELERLVGDRPPSPQRAIRGDDRGVREDRGGDASDRWDERDERDDARSGKGKPSKKDRKRRLAERLGDVFEEVLDF